MIINVINGCPDELADRRERRCNEWETVNRGHRWKKKKTVISGIVQRLVVAGVILIFGIHRA